MRPKSSFCMTRPKRYSKKSLAKKKYYEAKRQLKLQTEMGVASESPVKMAESEIVNDAENNMNAQPVPMTLLKVQYVQQGESVYKVLVPTTAGEDESVDSSSANPIVCGVQDIQNFKKENAFKEDASLGTFSNLSSKFKVVKSLVDLPFSSTGTMISTTAEPDPEPVSTEVASPPVQHNAEPVSGTNISTTPIQLPERSDSSSLVDLPFSSTTSSTTSEPSADPVSTEVVSSPVQHDPKPVSDTNIVKTPIQMPVLPEKSPNNVLHKAHTNSTSSVTQKSIPVPTVIAINNSTSGSSLDSNVFVPSPVDDGEQVMPLITNVMSMYKPASYVKGKRRYDYQETGVSKKANCNKVSAVYNYRSPALNEKLKNDSSKGISESNTGIKAKQFTTAGFIVNNNSKTNPTPVLKKLPLVASQELSSNNLKTSAQDVNTCTKQTVKSLLNFVQPFNQPISTGQQIVMQNGIIVKPVRTLQHGIQQVLIPIMHAHSVLKHTGNVATKPKQLNASIGEKSQSVASPNTGNLVFVPLGESSPSQSPTSHKNSIFVIKQNSAVGEKSASFTKAISDNLSSVQPAESSRVESEGSDKNSVSFLMQNIGEKSQSVASPNTGNLVFVPLGERSPSQSPTSHKNSLFVFKQNSAVGGKSALFTKAISDNLSSVQPAESSRVESEGSDKNLVSFLMQNVHSIEPGSKKFKFESMFEVLQANSVQPSFESGTNKAFFYASGTKFLTLSKFGSSSSSCGVNTENETLSLSTNGNTALQESVAAKEKPLQKYELGVGVAQRKEMTTAPMVPVLKIPNTSSNSMIISANGRKIILLPRKKDKISKQNNYSIDTGKMDEIPTVPVTKNSSEGSKPLTVNSCEAKLPTVFNRCIPETTQTSTNSMPPITTETNDNQENIYRKESFNTKGCHSKLKKTKDFLLEGGYSKREEFGTDIPIDDSSLSSSSSSREDFGTDVPIDDSSLSSSSSSSEDSSSSEIEVPPSNCNIKLKLVKRKQPGSEKECYSVRRQPTVPDYSLLVKPCSVRIKRLDETLDEKKEDEAQHARSVNCMPNFDSVLKMLQEKQSALEAVRRKLGKT